MCSREKGETDAPSGGESEKGTREVVRAIRTLVQTTAITGPGKASSCMLYTRSLVQQNCIARMNFIYRAATFRVATIKG